MTNPAVQLGKNYRAKVGDGATGTEAFNPIAGEQTLSYSTSPDKMDGSSKDDGNYKVNLYGQIDLSITVAGKVKLPDAGLSRIETQRKAGLPLDFQICNNTAGTGSSVVAFAAPMSIGQAKIDFEDKDTVSYSYELSLAGAPTVDALFG